VKVGDVADVHEREPQPWGRGYAGEQSLDRLQRVRVVVAERGADDRAGIDRGQTLRCAGVPHVLPSGLRGERL